MTTNRAYHPAILSQKRYLVLYGGAGSGKSYFAAQKVNQRCDATPGERFLVIRKVARTLKGSTFQLLRDVLSHEHIEHTANRSDLAIRFPNGSEIIEAGLDDVEKLKSIAGITSVWIEEATEVTEADLDQIDLRLRGDVPDYKQIILTFNPINGRHYLRSKFVEADRDDTLVIKTTWRDNAFIDPEYRRVLSQVGDANFRAIYDLGEWGEDVKGLIYPGYTTGPAPEGKPDAYGLDWGFVHPAAVVAIWDRDPVLHVQQVVHQSNLNTPQLIARMRDEGVDHHTPIYCDSAMPGAITELQAAGFNAFPADKAVEDGIATVQRFTLRFTPDSADLMAEADGYKWQELRDGEMKAKPVKLNDDGMDALRYAVHTHIGKLSTWGLW